MPISRLQIVSRVRGVAFGVSFTVALATARADSREPIRIEYRTAKDASCPSASEFDAQVFARTTSARPAHAGETARAFVVTLERAAKDIVGSLVIQEADGTTMARRVRGTECEEVATVLALATALAIDPRAELAPQQTLPPRQPPVQTSRQPLEGPGVDSAAAANAWMWRGALGGTVAFRVAPQTAIGASLLVALQRHAATHLSELGVEFAYRRSEGAKVRDAEASFQFYTARPTLCPSGIQLGASVGVSPCAALEVGSVTGVGSEIANSERSTRFWAAGEALLRLELALSETAYLTLDTGVQAPLTRYRFVFQNPQTQIHEVPAVTAVGALRIGMNF